MTEALNPELVTTLRVKRATPVAQDIRQFDLVHPEGADLHEFMPGAYLLVQAPNGATVGARCAARRRSDITAFRARTHPSS